MNDTTPPRSGVREARGLRPVINVNGTMTALGASIAVPEVAQAMTAILPEWVEINELHRLASRTIARLCGAEAGFVTASCSAGLTVACAAAMTGANLALIEQLPDTDGMKNEVLIQTGHLVTYGAPVSQGIRMSGAKVVPIGAATDVKTYQLRHLIGPRTAAAMYVVSHHCVQYGQIPLPEFAAICREAGVPVIVDAASEYDLRGFLAAGADVVIYSAHKFLGGPTGGIIAGRKDLVRACFLQNSGIGRGMKVGKETILGTIAALEAWERRDHAAVRAREQAALDLWVAAFADRPGVTTTIEPDPTNNPLDRLKVALDPEQARITAAGLADRLNAGDPPVSVRDHEIEHGFFYLDPCNLHPGEERIVADRIVAELEEARKRNAPEPYDLIARKVRRAERLLAWPD